MRTSGCRRGEKKQTQYVPFPSLNLHVRLLTAEMKVGSTDADNSFNGTSPSKQTGSLSEVTHVGEVQEVSVSSISS